MYGRITGNAMRVAEQYDPSSIGDVLVAQAKLAADQEKNFDKAENLHGRYPYIVALRQ